MEITSLKQTWFIILDIDGVLITTPMWKPDKMHADGYSDFCEKCVQNLNKLTEGIDTKIIISSSRRKGKTLEELKTILANRTITAPVFDALPFDDGVKSRCDEVIGYITENKLEHYLIIDDDKSLAELPLSIKRNCVLTTYASGFDEQALAIARSIIARPG